MSVAFLSLSLHYLCFFCVFVGEWHWSCFDDIQLFFFKYWDNENLVRCWQCIFKVACVFLWSQWTYLKI